MVMTFLRRTSLPTGRILVASLLVLLGCGREISVTANDEVADSSTDGGAVGGVDGGVDGGGDGAVDGGGDVGASQDGGADATDVGRAEVVNGVQPGASITGLQVLHAPLNDIQLPVVGRDGVSLLQWDRAGLAVTLYVDWSGSASFWYGRSGARYLYTAANGPRHLTLLYLASSYPRDPDSSDTAHQAAFLSYREFLSGLGE
jgi:hypothetical protein